MTVKLLQYDSNTWNHLIKCQNMNTGLFRNVIDKMVSQILFNIYVYIGYGIK